jgi:hypothetical protein
MANHLSFDTLSRLVEGSASTFEEPGARRHLTSCARCRSELEWLQRIQGQSNTDPSILTRARMGAGRATDD